MKRINRETWLNTVAKELKRLVFKPAGIELNLRKVKISVGYPPKGGASKNGKTIGVCFKRVCSDANVNEIFINPCLDKTQVTRVAGVLVHELIHAVEDCQGHGTSFRKMALACGLTGKMTATTETAELAETIKKIEKKVGKYPHKKLDYEIGRKKQTTRNLKVECPKCVDTDPYFVRMSKTMYDKGAPLCGQCGTKMTDDIIGATIKGIQKTSVPKKITPKLTGHVMIESNFTLLEQAMIFETVRISSEICSGWMTDLEHENLTYFIGEEMMDRLNWSKEKVGGVIASLEKKGAVTLDEQVGEWGTKYENQWGLNYYSSKNQDVVSLVEQWEGFFPEYCDNPYLA